MYRRFFKPQASILTSTALRTAKICFSTPTTDDNTLELPTSSTYTVKELAHHKNKKEQNLSARIEMSEKDKKLLEKSLTEEEYCRKHFSAY